MKFWDSSAAVPLLVPETTSRSLQRLYDADPVMFAWWATEIECTSAIARRQRVGHLRVDIATEAFARLSALKAAWHELEPGDEVRESAKRFLRVHDLRTANALQLAAAFLIAEARPSTLEFVSLDDRLLAAARREGFSTTRPAPWGWSHEVRRTRQGGLHCCVFGRSRLRETYLDMPQRKSTCRSPCAGMVTVRVSV